MNRNGDPAAPYAQPYHHTQPLLRLYRTGVAERGKQPRNHVPKQTCLQRRAGVRARGGSRLTNQEPDSGNVRCLTRICLALCLAEK